MATMIQPGPAPAPSLASRTGWCALGNLFTVGGRLIAGIVVARSLGPGGAGRVTYLLWIADTISIMAGLGLSAAATRFMADLNGQLRGPEAGALCRWVYVRTLPLIAAGVLSIAAIGRNSKDIQGFGGLWPAIALLYAAQALGICYYAWLSGLQHYDAAARMNAICTILLVAGTAAAAHGRSVSAVVLAYAASAILPAVFSLRLLWLERGYQVPETLRRRCLRYALLTWFATLLSAFVWSRTEIYFLDRYCDQRAVAMFAVGLSLSSLAVQGPSMLAGALLPHFAERSGARDTIGINLTYAMATRAMALLLFPACFGLAAITPVLLPAVYGRAFAPAVPAAIVLIAFASLGVANVGSSLVYGLEKSWFIAAGGVFGAALSIAGGLLIIPSWGPVGAAWSRSVVQCLMVALGTWYIARRLTCRPPLAALGKLLLAALASAAVARGVIVIRGDLAGMAAAILLAAASYAAMLRMLRAVDPEDLMLLKRACLKIPFGLRTHRALTWLVAAQ